MAERPKYRFTQIWLDDRMVKIVVVALLKTCFIAIRLKISFRERLELTFHLRSSVDFCHRCSLRSISLPSYQNRYTFTSRVSCRPRNFHRVRVFTAARGSQSRYTSSHMMRQYLCTYEIVVRSVCN